MTKILKIIDQKPDPPETKLGWIKIIIQNHLDEEGSNHERSGTRNN